MFTTLLAMLIFAAVPAVPGALLLRNGRAPALRWLGWGLLGLGVLILLLIPLVVPVSFESSGTPDIPGVAPP